MKIIVIITLLLTIATLTGCGTTKVYFRDCQKIDNGYLCTEE